MLKHWFRSRITAFERRYDYDMSYAREMLEVNRSAFMRFTVAGGLAHIHESVPVVASFAASFAATLREDCGPCAQLSVKFAEEASIPTDEIKAVVAGDPSWMSDDARLGWRFAQATLSHDPCAEVLREEIVRRWGSKAVVSLALAMAGARLFPTVKNAMGYGRTCQRIRVGDFEVAPRALTPTDAVI